MTREQAWSSFGRSRHARGSKSKKNASVAIGAAVLMISAAMSSPTPPALARQEADSSWIPPVSPASKHRSDERARMVITQIERPYEYRTPVYDRSVLEAIRNAPRHVFVPRRLQKRAYDDTPLPIGHGQTISQPYIVASMTELLGIGPTSKVLEIGTGSGYQAAVLAHLTPHVYTIEIIGPLATRARKTLDANGYKDVETLHADGYFGWDSQAPFDAIIVTCAAGHLPPPLWDQLKPGGRIVIPIGGTFSVQRLVVIEKTEDGKRKSRTIMGVRFVPMTGHAMEATPD
jgi:protein-L-isoaspartate(D-aspartate) O-methyltransferase